MAAASVQVVPIAGMTCRTCERRVERHIGQLPGVQRVSASASRAHVEIVSSGPVPPDAIAAAVEAAGYGVGRNAWISRDRKVWASAGAGLIVALGIVALAQFAGFADLAAGLGGIAEGGLVVALLLGLAAGVSTCLALTGGLVLALSAAFEARRGDEADRPLGRRLRPAVVFVTGRVVGFTLLGAALGAVGASLTLPPTLVATLMIAAAILMTILGTRLTGLSPRIAAWSPTLPGGLARRLGVDEGAVTEYSDARAAMLGAASFFLPCGFTQAVQVYALSTGSPVYAGAIMGVFAIGTVPGLLALGGLPSLVPAGSRQALLRVIGVVVLGFAVLNATAGLRLFGLSPSVNEARADGPTGPVPAVSMEDGVQVLRTFQVSRGYTPADTALYAGVPTRWIVESLDPYSCAVFLQVPSLGVAVALHEGENIIDLPPLPAGRVPYTCSMGMYGGTLTVVDGAPPASGGVSSGRF